ncbi:MAG: TIGR02300 family protein [Alphaproteobacteria bacterium]|nr:TIGR02300 family protein [Alphaproteobacteria bacterium]MBF0392818.1 TIGR02300 family protein [Alphaproteobacteria bacterium]
MAKPEWGVKRTCLTCGARFYDMKKSPIICPKCGGTVEPEVPFKARRSPAPEKAVAAPVKVVPVEAEEIDVAEEPEGPIDDIDGGDDDESGLIEDASDLGEDDDDMAEVMEHIDEDIDDEV